MDIMSHFLESVPSTVTDKSRKEAITDDFFRLLFESFQKERQVTFFADKLCLTPKYLSMTIKEVTGHPASSWINEMVILETKRLLKATELTALQVSEELNFPNPSFFGRFFKQHTGMTPLQFRKS
jgi:AraC-like DNA-binding protein